MGLQVVAQITLLPRDCLISCYIFPFMDVHNLRQTLLLPTCILKTNDILRQAVKKNLISYWHLISVLKDTRLGNILRICIMHLLV